MRRLLMALALCAASCGDFDAVPDASVDAHACGYADSGAFRGACTAPSLCVTPTGTNTAGTCMCPLDAPGCP